MNPADNDLDVEKKRVAIARRRLNGSIEALFARMKPFSLVSDAVIRARSGRVDWLALVLTLFRFRATAVALLGSIAAMRAKQQGKEEECEARGPRRYRAQYDNGRSAFRQGWIAMSKHVEDWADEARKGMSKAADTAGEEIAAASKSARKAFGKVRDRAEEYADHHREKSGVGGRIMESVKENPLAAVAGGIALGIAIGALFPRTEEERRRLAGYRDKAGSKAREVVRTIGDTLDEQGINRENMREKLDQVRNLAADTASQAGQTARDAIDRLRR